MNQKENIDQKLSNSLGILDTTTNKVSNNNNDMVTIPSNSNSMTSMFMSNIEGHIETDYNNARSTYLTLIKQSKDAINGILDVAEDSESPRAYEVAGQLIKQTAEVTKHLIDLQNEIRQIVSQSNVKTNNSNKEVVKNQAIFIGTPSNLLNIIKKGKIENDEDDTILEATFEEE